MPLILASSSAIRRHMLDAAGIAYAAVRPNVNESALKRELAGVAVAQRLAEAKALSVGAVRPGDLVIGSDSVVSVDERLFDKPSTRDDAVEHLRLFSGRTMELTSAVALARGDQIEWSHSDTACLHVRPLSDAFIDSYLAREWPEVSHCVGVFRLEGLGVQLFERIEGDYFTILGMPLLPLIRALRERQVIAT